MPTVLVVEDKDSDIRLLYQFLKSAGVENIKVASGAFFAINALEKAGEKSALKPDVMIVDLALGNDSGYEVLRYWKSNPQLADIKVIVWTGVGGKVDEEICRHFRVHSFVKKQEGPIALQQALAPILDAQL